VSYPSQAGRDHLGREVGVPGMNCRRMVWRAAAAVEMTVEACDERRRMAEEVQDLEKVCSQPSLIAGSSCRNSISRTSRVIPGRTAS